MLLACSAFQRWRDGEKTEGNSGYLRVWNPLSPTSITTTTTTDVKVFNTSLWMIFKGIHNGGKHELIFKSSKISPSQKKEIKNKWSINSWTECQRHDDCRDEIQAWKVQRCQQFAQVRQEEMSVLIPVCLCARAWQAVTHRANHRQRPQDWAQRDNWQSAESEHTGGRHKQHKFTDLWKIKKKWTQLKMGLRCQVQRGSSAPSSSPQSFSLN